MVDQPDEVEHRLLRPRGEPAVVGGGAQCLEERHPAGFGVPVGMADAGSADRTLGHVDDPLGGDGVIGIGHDPQIGKHILDFAPVVVLDPTDHLIRLARG